MKVLVLDAHSPASLAVVRSLAGRGLEVDVAGEEGAFNLAFSSRYPREKITYPSPSRSVGNFIASIKELAAKGPYRFIFPVTDRTIFPLHRFRESISACQNIALPDYDALEKTLDKRATLELAGTVNVPAPKTIFCSGIRELEEKVNELKFPVVVKSRFSKFIRGDELVSDAGPSFCNSREELIRAWREKDRLIPDPLIQEMVRGDGYGIFVLMKKGRLRALFAHHRLREEEPMGARSSYCESVEPPPRLQEYSVRLLQELHWTGPAMVEFKLDQRDGAPKLMEINGRFWGSLPLAIAAGVDFPSLYFQILSEERGLSDYVAETFRFPEEWRPARKCRFGPQKGRRYDPGHYKIGLKARYLYADFQHLINVLGGKPAPWMIYPGKFKTIVDFIFSFRPGIKYFNLDLRDPMPGIAENARFLFRELPRRFLKKK